MISGHDVMQLLLEKNHGHSAHTCSRRQDASLCFHTMLKVQFLFWTCLVMEKWDKRSLWWSEKSWFIFSFFFFRASISTLYYSFDFIHNLLADISMTISSFWRKLTAEADLTRVLSKAEGSMLMWQHTAFNFSQNTNKKWWVKKCTTFNLKPLSAKSKSGANSQWILPFLTPVCEKYQHVPHLPASSFFCYLDSNLKEVNSH